MEDTHREVLRLRARVQELEEYIFKLQNGSTGIGPLGDKYLTVSEVAEIMAVNTRTIWRMVKAYTFPQPVRYNRKLVRWRLSTVKQHMDNKVTEAMG